MRPKLFLAIAIFLSAPAAAARDVRIPPHVEVVLEVTSYGELPRDLVALLVPFFASKLYSRDLRLRSKDTTGATAAFGHSNGDFLVTAGRFNCIVVAYYSMRPGKDSTGRIASERSHDLEAALLDFVEGLPTPRPVLKEVAFGSRYCVAAT